VLITFGTILVKFKLFAAFH